MHEASVALASRLRGAPAVCNLCSSRLAFLVTLLAALRNRSVMVLPASGSESDIAAVLDERPGTIVVGDAADGLDPACDSARRAGRYIACRPERGVCTLGADDLAWLDGGVFYLPAIGNPTKRLCLIYAGAPLERTAARRWLRTRLDPVFLPRDFIRLDRLPRSETGKLRLHALDLAYATWQSAARPSGARRSAGSRERAVA